MPIRILHLLDESTNSDALEILSTLRSLPYEHHLVALGHTRVRTLAAAAGISESSVTVLPSLGWADPRPKGPLKRFLEKLQPTHIHAWGASALLNAHSANFLGPHFATFAHTPHGYAVQLLRRTTLSSRMGGHPSFSVAVIATSATIRSQLLEARIPEALVRLIRPGSATGPRISRAEIRRQLGIAAMDHPVILHAGEGRNARQDFAVWAVGIIQQLFPSTRLILHQDARTGGFPGIDRFANLPDENMLVTAPAVIPWTSLLPAADIVLASATGEIPTGSLRAAMRAGIPIVATPISCVTELLTHNETALIARHAGIGIAPPSGRNTIQPRAIAAEVERLLTMPGLGQLLAANAKAAVAKNFSDGWLLKAYDELYARVVV